MKKAELFCETCGNIWSIEKETDILRKDTICPNCIGTEHWVKDLGKNKSKIRRKIDHVFDVLYRIFQ